MFVLDDFEVVKYDAEHVQVVVGQNKMVALIFIVLSDERVNIFLRQCNKMNNVS